MIAEFFSCLYQLAIIEPLSAKTRTSCCVSVTDLVIGLCMRWSRWGCIPSTHFLVNMMSTRRRWICQCLIYFSFNFFFVFIFCLTHNNNKIYLYSIHIYDLFYLLYVLYIFTIFFMRIILLSDIE